MSAMNSRRVMTAIWFAVAGFIPAIAAIMAFSEFTLASYILFLALPIIFAGLSGYTIGFPITQEEKVKTEKQAVIRGLFVSITSYLFLGLSFIITAGIINLTNPDELPHEPELWVIIGVSVIVGLLILFPIFFFGQFLLLLASGAFAGWLLYKNQANIRKLLIVGGLMILPIGMYLVWSLPNPNNLPIYPNAINVQYGDFGITDSGTAEERNISFQTNDSFKDVLDYYEEQLVKDGWYHSYRSDYTVEVFSPSRNYRVRVEKNDNGTVEIRLWHSTLFSFP
jgi:hypothetical protein